MYYAKRKAFINFAEKSLRVLWVRSHLRWTERQWKHVLWSDESACFLGKTDVGFYVPKDEKDHPDCYQQKVKKTAWLVWYGGASVPTVWVFCIYVQRLMLEFWRNQCCRQHDDFSKELHVYFSRTMPGLILHKLQQHSFIGIECACLTGLPAVKICLLLKMYGASWRSKFHL